MQLRSLTGGRSLRLGQFIVDEGGSSSAAFSAQQAGLSYASAKDTWVKMLKGELPGVDSERDADGVFQEWAIAAGDAYNLGALTGAQYDADMDLAAQWYDYALQRLATGAQAQYTPSQGGGIFYQGPAPSLVAPGTRPTSLSPPGSGSGSTWLIAGGIGVAAIVLLTLFRRR